VNGISEPQIIRKELLLDSKSNDEINLLK
jgi:hypothetical protein